jgi:NAD(P)-dependent dehydrogenase (short-subunit alcohol dehydrogenase family)
MSASISANKPHILEQFSLKGKVVVITGGGRGLGLSFAGALAQVGADIACIDIHEQPHVDFASLASYGGKARYYK